MDCNLQTSVIPRGLPSTATNQTRRRRTLFVVKSSHQSDNSTSPDGSGEHRSKEVNVSRRQCLTCLCSTPFLISSNNATALDKPAGCRNCGGSGNIICEFSLALFLYARKHRFN